MRIFLISYTSLSIASCIQDGYKMDVNIRFFITLKFKSTIFVGLFAQHNAQRIEAEFEVVVLKMN